MEEQPERRQRNRRKSDRDLVRDSLERRRVESDTNERKRKLRRAIRHNCVAHLDYEAVEKHGSEKDWKVQAFKVKGRVLDLSAEGAALFTREPMAMGLVTSLRIDIYDGRQIEAQAEVRWSKHKEKKGGYATGVQFIDIDDDNQKKINAFLDELDETLGL